MSWPHAASALQVNCVCWQARTHSWTSQRSLEAQIATLRQQLDISAATEVELQREIEVTSSHLKPSSDGLVIKI